MSFYWPHAFWFLLIPVLGIVLELRRRRALVSGTPTKIIRAEAGPNHLSLVSTLATVNAPRVRWRLWIGLVLAVMAVARPQWGRLEEPVFDQSREIIIAVDLSRSMLADDIKPSRLERAKLLITSLLERLAGERVGLVVFSGTAFLQSPLSADYEILREFLPALKPDYLPEGGTNYKALIETSLTAFGAAGGADRFLIILSDGEAQTDDWKPLVEDLKNKGIRVIGLGIGTTTGAMLPDGAGGLIKDERGAVVLSKLESSTLIELANITSGVYADASTWIDLAELIKKTVDTGKRGEFREQSRIRLAERFQWLLAPALILLAWSFWREFPARPRVREIVLTGKKSNEPKPLAPTVAATLLGGLLIAALFGATPKVFAEDSAAQPLSKLVGDMSGRNALAARDYAELARTTITYGERQLSAQQLLAEGPIRDGLASVDQGSVLDPKAADWPKLRGELEKLLKKTEEEKLKQQQQKQQQQQPQDKKDNSQDKDKKDDPSQKQSGDSPDKSGDSKADKPKEGEKSPGSDSDQKNDPKDSSPKPDDSKKDEKQKEDAKQQQSAFGDMKDQKDKKPPPPPNPNDFQQVGGSPQKKSDAPPKDPALAIPLQKLDQLRDQDSPARLYQLMQDQQPKPAQKGKDW